MEKNMQILRNVLFLLFLTIGAQAQNVNRLIVPDINGTKGSTMTLPINMDNTCTDIVALQFELSVPNDVLTLNTSDIILTERCVDHTIVAEPEGNGLYKVLVYSPTNTPFKANSGELFGIGATIANEVDENLTFQLELSNVIISDKDGNNVVSGSTNGTFKIKPSADFTVTGIMLQSYSAMPNDTISISWQVNNVGKIASTGGWSERLSFVSTDGTEIAIGTFHNDTQALLPNESMSRNADIVLPSLLGIDGGVNVNVTVVPNTDAGEDVAYQKNNTTQTNDYAMNIGKNLYITYPISAIQEGSHSTIRCELARSGSWAEEQTFYITKTAGDERLSIPTSVTIPRGQSSAFFYCSVSDNDLLDSDSLFTIQASGNGYEAVSSTLVVEDDEYPQLTLSVSKSEITEGETFQLTVTTQETLAQPLAVSLIAEYPKRFSFPSNITIPAGENSATMDVTAVDNEELEPLTSVAFKAVADKHADGECIVILNDNDLPVIELELSPSTVTESAGMTAIFAKIRRTTNIDRSTTIRLSDDSNGSIYYPSTNITLEEGVEEAQFSLGIIDNSNAEGNRTVNITAAVYISSCDCAATGTNVGIVSKAIEIIDDDGPALSVTSSKSTLLEGDEKGTVITIRRNTKTENALTVNISSDYDKGLSYEHTVTIPAGEESADVNVTALSNDQSDDSRTIVFTVEAADFAKGTCWLMLTDQTLPDVTISAISLSTPETQVGGDIDVNVTISNIGVADLPEVTPIGIYIGNSTTPALTIYLQEALSAGGQISVSRTVTMPDNVGSYDVYAVANDGRKMSELLYVNNTSEKVKVNVVSPFTVSVNSDKSAYNTGEQVVFSGQASGNAAANADIEVYVINDGYRHVINAKTDGNGFFTTTYEPYSGQMGHFIAGACYPGEGLSDEQTAFDVYGLKRTSNSPITCETLVNETYNGSISLRNPSTLSLTGVNAKVISKPDYCDVNLNCPATIEGGSTVDVNYSIVGNTTSQGNAWEQIQIEIETAEGPTLATTLYFYCRNANGKLQANVSSINTTMVKGANRDYPIVITNVGKGETGKITLALPSWMKPATPSEMASLSYGDSTTIVLRLSPTDEMQLNVPVTGTIGINCENGEGIPLSYTIEPVSETTGTLVVNVCDEYTYYTAEGPHVSGAQVLVKHPTTGTVMAQGLTDESGRFTAILPEGYYALSVTADNHDSYKNNILVDPGRETIKTVNLSFQAITIDWNVEETEIEGEYLIETTVKYETNVPMPVVELIAPSSIAAKELQPGESLIFYATLTNKGLITAQDVELLLPDGFTALSFEALSHTDEPFDLAPQQSVTVPVMVSNISQTQSARALTREMPIDDDPCVGQVGTLYYWDCGLDRKWHRYGIALQLGTCQSDDPSTWDNPGNGSYGGGLTGGPYTGFGGYGYGSSTSYKGVDITDTGCEPCQNQILIKMVECGLSFIPVYGCVKGTYDCGKEAIDGDLDWRHYTNCTLTGIGCSMELCAGASISTIVGTPVAAACEVVGTITNIIGCLVSLTEPCDKEAPSSARIMNSEMNKSPQEPSFISEYRNKVLIPLAELEAYNGILIEYFGDSVWVSNTTIGDLFTILSVLNEYENDVLDSERLIEVKPEGISKQQFQHFIARLNNTSIVANGGKVSDDNFIHHDILLSYYDKINESENKSKDLGYSSTDEMWMAESERFLNMLNESQSSVCSSITLKFTQTMTMTRQAFRGTLTVFNGNEETPMENIRLNLEVRGEDGMLATSREFQINAESLDGFTGELDLTSGWSLAANETGVATILFIPTKNAALEADKDYSFGGSLTYTDPFTGLEVTRDLYPVTLTVKPSPELDLTYFMQRDVYGDDALTTDVVESSEPAEFALIINNKGYGDANNVKLVTNQPEIIENEKGLLIDFELISSQLNGQETTLALGGSVATEFGTIPAHSQTYAQWWLRSSLLGHFTDYDVKATHVTSYGNEDLSLLDNVTIHELVRGFTADDNGDVAVRAFLVNDIVDAEDQPDMIYFTDGREEESVTIASTTNMQRISDTEYIVTVTSSAEGWTYGSTNDLTAGRQKLVSVVRQSDGALLPADNFWLTDRTLRDGKDPLYEYKLHFAAEISNEETFRLTFEPRPNIELSVESFSGIPEEGTVLTSQLESVGIKFNKAIDSSSFTVDDLSLNCQGKKVDLSGAIISKINDREFNLALGGVTAESGHYVLTVQTEAITDNEGYTGSTGKSASWIQFADGKVAITLTASPAEGGTISPATGRVDYGSEVTIKATPAEGYDFSCWMNGDETISEEPSFDYVATQDKEFTAVFTLKHFNVNIDYDPSRGFVENVYPGIYSYGTVLNMTAVPYDGYKFSSWLSGTDILSYEATYSHIVKDDIDITADFTEDITTDITDLNSKSNKMFISPVPLQDIMYVHGNFNAIKQLIVADISGMIRIVKADLKKSTGVDVSILPEGIYFIRVVTDNGIYSKKVYKKR